MSGAEAQRIDKWLWHARFAKTRSGAQRLVLAGHVRVNREKVVSASRLVRSGDVLTIALGRGVAVVRVCGIAERRGSPVDAQALYRPAGDEAAMAASGQPASQESDE
jgi:ribosome-associated heat shock protein Hsp15